MPPVNESEEFVHDLCRKSFLSLWSVENPLAPDGKELCDALVVMGEVVIVVSVKDCSIKASGNDVVDVTRWWRKAVDASVKQLGGAARALGRMSEVKRRDNPDIALPLPSGSRRVHLVAVALGGDERIPLGSSKYDCGFVHVFDRESVRLLLGELDTAPDFVDYLGRKEEYAERCFVRWEGGEQDLLAIYLREGRKFPEGMDALFLQTGLWTQLTDDPSFVARKVADKVSYAWDHLIEEFAGHLRHGTLLGNATSSDIERGLRLMVSENRFQRRLLGDSFIGFIKAARDGLSKSRNMVSSSGVVYVFIACPRSMSNEIRVEEMTLYCAVLRERHPDAPAIVGIITERPDGDRRQTFGLAAIDRPLDDELRGLAAEGRRMGILAVQNPFQATFHEYPAPVAPDSGLKKRRGGRSRVR